MPAAISDAEIQRTLEVLAKHSGNQTHAGVELGISQNTVWQRLITARRRGLVAKDAEAEWRSRESQHSGRTLPQTAEECWVLLDDYIGRSLKRVTEKPPKARKSHRKKMVIASDLHGPFNDPWAVAEMVNRELNDTDTLVLNGDIFDLFSVSRFIKDQHVPFEMELAAVDALLGQFSKRVPDILVTTGNHDGPRFEKSIRTQLSPEMMNVVEFLTGGQLDPVKVLAKRYRNIRFAPIQVDRFSVGWLAQEGDLVIAHAEKYSKVPSAATRMIDEWLTDFHDTLGLKPWRVLVQGHTHALSRTHWKSDRLLMESGCLCKTAGYQLVAKVGGRPQRRGYVTIMQEDGECDINHCREWNLDAERARSAA